jgi:hypothetical protein
MMTKKCDNCGKDIESKNPDSVGYSEWCVFHYKKRRDFCSDKCFLDFILKKLILDIDNEEMKGGKTE